MTRQLLRRASIVVIIFVLFMSGLVWYNLQQPQPELPVATITVGDRTMQVEIASTPAERERGLMFRQQLTHDGMLFVYPTSAERQFWMRNTGLPLSIAFFDHDGRILNVADLRPFDETPVRSAGSAWCALEVAQGWFAEHDIQAGQVLHITLPPAVKIQ